MVLAGACSKEENVLVVDYKGDPVDKTKTGGWLGAGLILGTELAERMCVMGIAMNLVTYLVGDLHLSNSQSATVVTNFMGTLNLLALLGGFLADAKFGRFLTVAIFSMIAALGATLLTISTSVKSMQPPPCDNFRLMQHGCIPASGGQLAMLYASLYTIALGAGGIKSNCSGFGSDQFDPKDPKEEKAMIFFFNRFYFCISIGSLFAVTVLVYLQDNVGRGWGYGISAVAMALSVMVLVAGTPKYRYRVPEGSPLTVIWKVLYLAFKQRKVAYPNDPNELEGYFTANVAHTEKFRCLDKAAISVVGNRSSPEKQSEKRSSTVTEVEEVKMVVKLLPIWATCILFWTIYSQMTTFSVEQATYMDRRITGSFLFPSGSLSVFLFITILTFTSLNEKLLVPIAGRITHNPQGITSLQRIAVGLFFSMLAMAVSAIVEKKRRDASNNENNSISVFWLVPQFFLVGAGEAFAYVGQLEFFIREGPARMKSMSTGLFLATVSMGFFFSSLLVTLVDKVTKRTWITNNLNKGRLDYFYWMLAILGAVNFVVFLVLARRHEYKVEREIQEIELKDDKVEEAVKGMDV
ncbi:Protein NRT1/ PTR FAMILY 4.4 [Rhynchospora pubera]|uniref:Protein NRT1/ PTR FAMILY 4.4 n=1 Tax=Rhynchospora pubera TaxID=906938 RepID=A0AAV8FSZ4_9POAL|nr:Protein NRT1/ PTR FAMILY 4.4 [Rhynchospora pubera]